MSIEFPYRVKLTKLGEVVEAKIPVEIVTQEGYRTFLFLVDPGSDCTMLPRFVADYLGIALDKQKKGRSYGIEKDEGIAVYSAKIRIKIGGTEFSIRCLISEKDTTPFLLRRMDVFDKFSVIFDNEKEVVRFVEVKTRGGC